MAKGYAYKAGCEEPATSQRSDVISTPHVMPTAGMAGSFSRKIPGPEKSGQDVAGEANQVEISFKSKSPGKKTWEGSVDGETTKSVPKYTSAEVGLNTGKSTGGKQKVKGK